MACMICVNSIVLRFLCVLNISVFSFIYENCLNWNIVNDLLVCKQDSVSNIAREYVCKLKGTSVYELTRCNESCSLKKLVLTFHIVELLALSYNKYYVTTNNE